MSDPLAPLARRLGWTPSQAWTVLPGLALAVPVLLATVLGVRGAPVADPAEAATLPPGLPALPAPAAASPPPSPVPTPDPVVPVLPGADPPVPVAPPVPLPPAASAPPDPAAAPLGSPRPSPAGPRPTAGPLRISDNGWTSTVGNDPTVPAGDLPVQAGPAGEVARAFVRLEGAGVTLRLALDTSPGAGFGEGGVLACHNTSERWLSGSGQQPAAAPPYDPARCTPARRSGDVLTFDLTGFAGLATAGVSLLPDPPGPAPFRLALRTIEESP